jgi:hypothetical protein
MTSTTTPSRAARRPGRHRSQRHAAAHVAQYIHELSERHAGGRRAITALERPAPQIAYVPATR